jgi:hypothetical protein
VDGTESGNDVDCSETGTDGATSTLNIIEMSTIGKKCEMDFSNTASDDSDDDPIELEKRRHFLQDESRQYPKEKIAYLILLWVGLTVITFLKGGKGVDSVIGITCQDAGYYALVAAQFLLTLGFAAIFGKKILKRTKAKMAVNYPFLETDVLWDAKKMMSYSFFTFFCGNRCRAYWNRRWDGLGTAHVGHGSSPHGIYSYYRIYDFVNK